MAKRNVIAGRKRRGSLGRKWKRAGLGIAVTSATVVGNGVGIIPLAIFGFLITIVGALTAMAVLDASWATFVGTGEEVIYPDGDLPDDENAHTLDRLT